MLLHAMYNGDIGCWEKGGTGLQSATTSRLAGHVKKKISSEALRTRSSTVDAVAENGR